MLLCLFLQEGLGYLIEPTASQRGSAQKNPTSRHISEGMSCVFCFVCARKRDINKPERFSLSLDDLEM